MRTKRPSTAESVFIAFLGACLGGRGVGNTPHRLPRALEGSVVAHALTDRVLVVLLVEHEAYLYKPADGSWSAPIALGANTPTSLITVVEMLWGLSSTSVQRCDDWGARCTALSAKRDRLIHVVGRWWCARRGARRGG